MRYAAVIVTLLGVLLPASALAGKPERPQTGSLIVEGGRGVITIKAKGLLLGRIERGIVQITDLSPKDRWTPVVNVTTPGRVRPAAANTWRGEGISFRLLGGTYKLTIRGEGISISAKGAGWATLDGEPDLFGWAGVYSTGDVPDCQDEMLCEPIPDFPRRVQFPVFFEEAPEQQRASPQGGADTGRGAGRSGS